MRSRCCSVGRLPISRVLGFLGVFLALVTLPHIGAAGSTAQARDGGASSSTDSAPAADPFEAYREERFDAAARGFERLREERPGDPVVDLNLGTARYRMGEFEAAGAAYQAAALAEDPQLRSEALYNLGNVAYREGRLAEAIEHYTQALDLNPGDEDAKYNLEFVQRQLEQQQQQQQDQQDQGEEGDRDDQSEQGQSGDNSNEGEEEKEGDDSQSQNQPQGGGDPGQDADEDQDGLSDEQERSAENPTDPSNPDTDGDGRLDGEEDANRNGRVDPGETDPNEPDPRDPQESEGSPQPQNTGQRQMTPEEAQRFLQALQEERPTGDRKASAAALRQEKDW